MTSLGQIRIELLQQHNDIRKEIETTRAVCAAEPFVQEQLDGVLDRLVTLVNDHNLAEEDALRNILPDLDVFGTVRKDVMMSDHMAEHQALHSTLVAASSGGDSASVIVSVLALLDRMLAHMEHEENLFLSAKLLGSH